MQKKFQNIDEYHQTFPKEVQEMLDSLRVAINDAAPGAEETISYNMPAFKLHGILVYYAAFKNHIGFYALPSGNEAFKKQLLKYKTGKGSIQFPISEPLPITLIKKMVAMRVKENIAKAKAG